MENIFLKLSLYYRLFVAIRDLCKVIRKNHPKPTAKILERDCLASLKEYVSWQDWDSISAWLKGNGLYGKLARFLVDKELKGKKWTR